MGVERTSYLIQREFRGHHSSGDIILNSGLSGSSGDIIGVPGTLLEFRGHWSSGDIIGVPGTSYLIQVCVPFAGSIVFRLGSGLAAGEVAAEAALEAGGERGISALRDYMKAR